MTRRAPRRSAGLAPAVMRVVAGLPSAEILQQSLAIACWPRAAGEAVAAISEAQTIRNGVLLVHTRSSAWAQELSMLKPALLRQLNELVGPGTVRDIRFAGLGRKPDPPPAADPWPTPEELDALPLIEPEQKELAEMAAGLSGAEERLRAHMERSLRRAIALRHWQVEHGWTLCRRCRRAHRDPGPICRFCEIGA